MKVDLLVIFDWLARIAFLASLVRVALHWAKDGVVLWIEPGASFWGFYAKLEATMAWLAISLQKFGSRRQVAEEAIKDMLEHPVGQEVNVTVTPVEPKR